MLLLFLIYLLPCYPIHEGVAAMTQDTKIWTANTNFENPRNWRDGRLPCANDRVLFPPTTPVISFMPTSFSFSEVVLPLDGQLIFPDGAQLLVTGGTKEGTCHGKDVHFVVNMDFWYDTNNWNISSSRAHPTILSGKNAAVPDAFRVPCPTDHVVFPKDTSFMTHLDPAPISVGSIEVNGVGYNNEEFQGFLGSSTGSLLFPNSPNIMVKGTGCEDPSGCTCGNDDPKVLLKICFRQNFCPPLQCSDPVTPTGYCCPICGAYLAMEFEPNFRIENLVDLHESYLSKATFHQVESFTAKTHENLIQSVFVDAGNDRGSAGELAQTVRNMLIHDIETAGFYKLRSVQIYKSEKWETGVATHAPYTTGQGMSSGGVAAVVVIAAIVLVGAVLALYLYKRRHIPGFSFARFDLDGGKVELELGTTPHDDLDPQEGSQSVDKAFDNPVYGTAAVPKEEQKTEDFDTQKDFVENPMFMVFEDNPTQENKS